MTTAPNNNNSPPPLTPRELATVDENLAAARLIVRNRTPYFLSAILAMVFVEDEHVLTIGTTRNLRVAYNPRYILEQDAETTAGLLVHEVLHVWHEHFNPARLASRDPERANRAQDRAINPSILEAGFKLPKGGCFPKDLGMRDGLTWEEYYEREPESPGGGGACASGQCGGCAGNPNPGEPGNDEAQERGEARSDVEVARVLRQVAEAVRDAAAKPAGNVPGAWARTAALTLKPPRIPWERKLAHAVRHAVAVRDGATTHRYDAPSRRQSGLGFGDGVPVLPRMREEVPDVLIGLDTSGSMGTVETETALNETTHILRALGVEARFGVCDAQMHGLKPVASAHEVLAMLKGGGGTDFRPFFAAATQARPRPSVVVFFTDGYGPAPAAAPPYPVVWVYVGPHVTRAARWGQHVRIPVREDEDVTTIEEGA